MLRGWRWITLHRKTADNSGSFARLSTQQSKASPWEVTIGIEVHAQIKSKAKLFSHSRLSTYDEKANSHVAAFDGAFPGTLPILDSECVALAVRTAFALNCAVQRQSAFDRKHYFYADLPAGYQITQHYKPLAINGNLHLRKAGINIRIQQLQLEQVKWAVIEAFISGVWNVTLLQDTAKSVFDSLENKTVVDLNRAGTGLMEIVSEPDIRSIEAAGEYVRTLQSLLRAVDSSNGNMEEGSLRCDANVSVNLPGEPLGTRCEIKNLNSVRFMMAALTFEVQRHIALKEDGHSVAQETRGFDEKSGKTFKLRSKEDSPDYRYMPDPNLPPLILDQAYIDHIRSTMPELPETKRLRLSQLGLAEQAVDLLIGIDFKEGTGQGLTKDQGITAFFEQVARSHHPLVAFNWISHDLYGLLTARGEQFKDNSVSVKQMIQLLDLIQGKKITGTSAKLLLKQMIENHNLSPPSQIAADLGLLAAESNDTSITDLCSEVIAEMPDEVISFKNGKEGVLNRIVGRVMKKTKGRYNAQTVKNQLLELLSKV